MEKPHTVASPQVGLSSVARMRMVVVLPAPLGPMNPYTSPFSSLSVSRSRAYRSPYIFVRSRVSIMGYPLSGCLSPLSPEGRGERTDGSLFFRADGHEHPDIRVLDQRPGQGRPRLVAAGQGAEPEVRRQARVV